MTTGRQAGDPSLGESPLGRLSRFDGTSFLPVIEGSVDAPFVHVFVHGWQPGFRLQERLHAVTDVVHALPAWDPRLIDPTGRTLVSYYLHLLEALAELGPDHCVLHYSWLDESATDADLLLAFRSRQATQINGRRLALALQQSYSRQPSSHQPGDAPNAGPQPRLHLIGHSHGSAVAAHAAAALARPPEQVTLLDAPEGTISRYSGAADLIDVALPRIQPGRNGDRPFVDSYSSVFGRPYHRKPGLSAVVDVVLTPSGGPSRDPIRAINGAHLYAVDWYALSVRDAERGVGYGWSPLRGADVTTLRSFQQSARPHRPLELRPRKDLPRPGAARRLAARPTQRTRVDVPGLRLSTATPAAALILHSVPGDRLVEFDIAIQGGDGNELVQLEVDAVPAFVTQARFPVPESGRYVMLADGRPGEHLLTARLITTRQPAGRTGDRAKTRSRPRVSITNLTMVNSPGAATWFSFQRAATAAFFTGVAAGSIATLLTLLTTSWTVHKLVNRLTRRRRT
jgi:hypothetical protein